MVQVKWTKRALGDLREIYDFIAKDSPRYAQLQVEGICEAASNLAMFPNMGRHVPEFPHLPYREILFGSYRILYRAEEEQERVLIISILHGRRLLQEPPNYR